MPDGTYQCPVCGSSDLNIHVTLSEQVDIHEILRIKGKREGRGRSFKEVLVGDDLRKSNGKWMNKRRVIDREVDEYEEVITDPETGEIVHNCHEPLSEHTGHGAAKRQAGKASTKKLNEEEQNNG